MKKLFLILTMVMAAGSSLSAQNVTVTRLNNGQPIISEEMFLAAGATENEGHNINGPSVIRIPDWIAPADRLSPEAKYYIYFADHTGKYIRMAWAANIEGPWNLYNVDSTLPPTEKGAFALSTKVGEDEYETAIYVSDNIILKNHIASPYAVVDDENKRIILYYHTGDTFLNGSDEDISPQKSYVTYGADGVNFDGNTQPAMLGTSYFVPFTVRGEKFAFANGGSFYQYPTDKDIWSVPASHDITTNFYNGKGKILKKALEKYNDRMGILEKGALRVRHCGVYNKNDKELYIFYSIQDEAPEHLFYSVANITKKNPSSWGDSCEVISLMKAEEEWEGSLLEPKVGRKGHARSMLNDIRDPHVFEDEDGKLYLFYVGGGERAIGVASLTIK